MPSRKDLGTAHLDPPLARVTLPTRQPEPAWQQRVAPGPDGRQRHLSVVWDLALGAQGVQADLRIPFPCPLACDPGGFQPTRGAAAGGHVCLPAVAGTGG